MSNLFKDKTVPTQAVQETINKPYINKFADKNIDLGNQRANTFIQGGGTADFTGNSQGAQSTQAQQALQGIWDTAGSANASALGNAGVGFASDMIGSGGMSPEQQQALAAMRETASGKYLDPENGNPYLKDQLAKMSDDIQNRVSSMAAGSGRYGSGSHNGMLGREIGGAVGNVLSQNYENERNRQLSAAGAWNSALEGGLNRASGLALNGGQITDQLYSPFERKAGVGDYYDQRNQGAADAALNKFLMNRDNDKNDLSWLTGIANNAPVGNMGQTTTTGTTTKPSALTSALGAGASLAGLIGKLSDRRAKTDITRIGTAFNGLPLYLYRYKDGGPFEVGVMAQEVERMKPGAVTEEADGYKRVRYDLAFAE